MAGARCWRLRLEQQRRPKRAEGGLRGVQLSLDSQAQLDSENLLLDDIRNNDTLRRLLRARRPEVVLAPPSALPSD